MNKRIAIVAAVVIIIAGAAGWYLATRSNTPGPAAPSVNTNDTAGPTPIQPGPAKPATASPSADRALQVASMTFAERFGTFSSDAPYENLTYLSSLVTPSYAQSLTSQIKTAAAVAAGGFYGVTTRALSAKITSASGTAATVTVATQRQETFSRQGTPRLTYQSLDLTLDRSSGTWLVAGARWEK